MPGRGRGDKKTKTAAVHDPVAEDARRAEAARHVENEALVGFILQDKMLEQHLRAVVIGRTTASWHSASDGFGSVWFDDDQLDRVYKFLSKLVSSTVHPQRRIKDRVKYIFDILLPETIIHSLTALKSASLTSAKQMYRRGVQYSKSELNLLEQQITGKPKRH